MASETAMFESGQALFCAIADLVGKDALDKVLNLKTFFSFALIMVMISITFLPETRL